MINIEYVKYLPTFIDDINDKELKGYLKSMRTLIDEIKNKKLVNLKNQSEKLVTVKTIN